MVVHSIITVLLVLTLAGCATNNELKPVALMPEAEYAQLMLAQSHAGTGSVSGKLYFTDSRGKIYFGDNSNMLLWPATPYTEKREKAKQRGVNLPDQYDPRINPLTRRTHSNSVGEFQFDAVPAGAYFIWSYVYVDPLTKQAVADKAHQENVSLQRRVVVEKGQQTAVFLTND